MRVGVAPGAPQSALLVPVPAAERLVGAARAVHDPVAAAGVPAHVTLIAPWVEPAALDDELPLADLREALAGVAAFAFDLAEVGWFSDRVLWLAPTPAGPFVELTAALAARFGTAPWAGKFDEIVPHLTVGHAPLPGSLDQLAADLKAGLPLSCRAEEVWVMVAESTRWQLRFRVPLSAPTACWC